VDGRPEVRVKPGPGGLESIAKSYGMHRDLLLELLELFYIRSQDQEGRDVYERPAQRKDLIISYILVLVQLLEGAGIQASEFEALRAQLKMNLSDLAMRFRELGSHCRSTTILKNEDVGASGGRISSFNVFGLKEGCTLRESFPGLKLGGRK
jgi:hypothetical protein